MKPKKRVFIGLLLVSLLFFIGVIIGIIYIYYHRISTFYRYVLILAVALSFIILTLVALGLGAIVLTILSTKTYSPLQSLMIIAIKILFPTALKIGSLLNIPPELIKSSFIEVNNHLVKTRGIMVPPERILILAPHCLQKSFCPHKITNKVENCKRCGKCKVSALLELTDSYGVKLAVVPGGTLARKFVRDYRPKAIVAIACERDLTSGIQDITPIPVIGVLNMRPEGPCFNTDVNIADVERAISLFVKGET
jgi:hypothetical protein